MKTITIDRSKWRRGGDKQENAGDTALLNEQGFMCCLGFICLAEGFTVEEILKAGEPCDINISVWDEATQERAQNLLEFENDEDNYPTVLTKEIVVRAIRVNDSEDDRVGDPEREAALKEIFHDIYDLQFVDGVSS